MKINKLFDGTVFFGDLEDGDLFMSTAKKNIYMKVKKYMLEDGYYINIVDLSDNDVYHESDSTPVIPIDGELNVVYKQIM